MMLRQESEVVTIEERPLLRYRILKEIESGIKRMQIEK